MDVQTILDYIIVIAPTIASVLGVIVGFVKIISSGKENAKSFTEAVTNINESLKIEVDERRKDTSKLEAALSQVLTENANLKRENAELKSMITGVKEA